MKRLILIVLLAAQLLAQEESSLPWKTGVLTATVEALTMHDNRHPLLTDSTAGEGLATFSLVFGKALQAGGDITLCAALQKAEVSVFLKGASLELIGSVEPKRLTRPGFLDIKIGHVQPLTVGNYYLVERPGLFTLLQPIDIKVTDRENDIQVPGRASYVRFSRATIEFSFKYLRPQESLEKLNSFLSQPRKKDAPR